MLNLFNKRKAPETVPRFSVPEPDPFENPLVETHPGQLRQWADDLPDGNPGMLAESILASLVRLNRFPGAVKKREELMEIYHKPCRHLLLANQHQKNPLPQRLKRLLTLEMAYGHIHLINECLQQKASDRLRNRLVKHIYLTIRFIALEYLYACEEYDCRLNPPRKDLMRFYNLAEVLDLKDIRQEESEDYPASISQQTKLILLFSLLDPCHLQTGESQIVFNYLSQFAEVVRFVPLNTPLESGGLFVIDRLGELPNSNAKSVEIERLDPARFILLDVVPASQRLHQHLRSIEQTKTTKPVGLADLTTTTAANLLRRMLKSWYIRLQRDSERHDTSGQVKLYLGLPAIHQQLSAGSNPPTVMNEADPSLSVTLKAEGAVEESVNEYPTLDSWRSNQSRSGIALHLAMPVAFPPQVGEIALLKKPESNRREDMKVGIIRRALLVEDNILEIGIQFINGKLVPLLIQALGNEDTDDDDHPNLPALYIDFGAIERSSLITPKDIIKIGHEYRVEEMIPAPSIRLVHLVEIAAKFERYRLIPA